MTWDVTAGALVMSNTAEEGRVTVQTTNAIMHESYNANTITNDIALLILPVPVSGANIKPLRLPTYAMDAEDKVGQVLRVSGWGKSSDASTTINDHLKYVDVTVIGNLECRRHYVIGISSTNICTSSNVGTEATCNGDSGGPLVQYDINGDAIIFGIVSFGSSAGCETDNPSAYTRVTKYLDWISINGGITIDP
ncbi:hypothetical protein B566_EDAN019205 [Ephemera danica]|nr:hypothetical protein B566_EDAN019205 [Ephemera danica]